MNGLPVPLALVGAALLLLFQLLRTRRMREKYAVGWTILGIAVILLALFPAVLEGAARLVGVQVPANLLFFVSALVLYVVCIQFSVDLSRLAEDRRVLVEETAVLRLEGERLDARVADLERRLKDVEASPTSPDRTR
jgi:hypothetical protein